MRFAATGLFLLAVQPLIGAAELRTLKNEVFTGDLIGLSDKEATVKVDKKDIATPVGQILFITLQPPAAPKADTPFSEVELTDGTVLRCKTVGFKNKEAKLTLLGGQEIVVPIEALSYFFHEAHESAVRAEWQKLFGGKKRNRDIVVRKVGAKLTSIAGTLSDADAQGTNMDFVTESGRKVDVPLAKIQGLYFQRQVDPNAKPALFKLIDKEGNSVFVASATLADKALAAQTPSGAKVIFPLAQVIKLDYSGGKLAYLSDFGPEKMKIAQTSTVNFIEPVRRDMSLEQKPLSLGRKTFDKGLALHARTEITFDLDGEYRQFKAVVGIDDNVPGRDGGTLLKIFGDGKELLTMTVVRKDKPQEKTLNIKDVQKLTILVASNDLLDLGRHLDLADARVSK